MCPHPKPSTPLPPSPFPSPGLPGGGGGGGPRRCGRPPQAPQQAAPLPGPFGGRPPPRPLGGWPAITQRNLAWAEKMYNMIMNRPFKSDTNHGARLCGLESCSDITSGLTNHLDTMFALRKRALTKLQWALLCISCDKLWLQQ